MDAYLFSDAWARACRDELNASAAYREAAATWEGAVVFIREGDGGERGVFVDLWHGECREARATMDGDPDRAPFVIRGLESDWTQVLAGAVDPLVALATGRLRLTKGNLGALAFHIRSARELVAAACRVQQRGAAG